MSETLVLPSDAAYRERALPLVERQLTRVAHHGGAAIRRFAEALIEHRMPLGLTEAVVRTACSTCGVTTRVPVLDLGWLTYCDVCGHRLLAGDTPWSEIVGPRPPNQAWGMFDHRTGRLRRHSLGLRAELVVGRHRIALPGGDLGQRHLLASGAARPSRLLVHNAGRRPLAAGLLATDPELAGARDPLPLIEPGEATILSLERGRAEIRLFVGAEHTLEARAVPVISVELAADLQVDVQFRGLECHEEGLARAESSEGQPEAARVWTVTGDVAGIALRFAPLAPTIEGATATLTIGDRTRRLLAHVRRRPDGPPDHEWLAVDAFADAPPGAPFRVDVRYRTVLAVVTAKGRLAGVDPRSESAPAIPNTEQRSTGSDGPGPSFEPGSRASGSTDVDRADPSLDRRAAYPLAGDVAQPATGLLGPSAPAASSTGRPWNVPLIVSVHAGAVAARRLDEAAPLSTGQGLADDTFAIEPDGRVRVGLAAVDWALDDWKRRPLGVDWWQALTSGDGRVLDPSRPARTAVGRPTSEHGPVTAGQVFARALDSHLRRITRMRSGHPDQIALVLPPRATEVHLDSVRRLLSAAAPSAELFLELDTSAALVLDALRGELSKGGGGGARRIFCVMLEAQGTTVVEHRVRWQSRGPGGRRLEVHSERGQIRGLSHGLDRFHGVIEDMLHQSWSRARDVAERRARDERVSDARLWLFDARRRQQHTSELRDRRRALMRGAAPALEGAVGLSETTRLPVEQDAGRDPTLGLPPAEQALLGRLARFALGALASHDTVAIGEAPEQRRLLRHIGPIRGNPPSTATTLERGAVIEALRPAVAELVEALRPLVETRPTAGRNRLTATAPLGGPLLQTRSMTTTLSGLPGLPRDSADDEVMFVVHAPAVVISAIAVEWARSGLEPSLLHPAPVEQRPELRGAVDYYAATRFGLGAFDPQIEPVGQRVLVAVSPAGQSSGPLIPCGCRLGTAWTWLPVERPACMLHFVSWAGEVVAHAVRSLDGLSFIGDATFAELRRDRQLALRVWVESRFDEHRRAVMGEIVRLEGGTWLDAREHVERLRRSHAAPAVRSGSVLRPASTLPDGMRETPVTVAPFEFHEYPGFFLDRAVDRGR